MFHINVTPFLVIYNNLKLFHNITAFKGTCIYQITVYIKGIFIFPI